MKVQLIQPNLGNRVDRTSTPHAGLGYLAAYALEKGCEVNCVDAKFEGIDNEAVVRRIRDYSPDVLGITVRTPDVREAEKIARFVKKETPRVKVVVGGAHVTGVNTRVLDECEYFDIGVSGEGELTLCEVLDHFSNGLQPLEQIPGIVYRNGDRAESTCPREPIQDLDSLLFPAWHLFPVVHDLPIFSSRGCPFKCIFCQRVMGSHVRTMSPERVVAEMKRDIQEFDAKFLQIEDEIFGVKKAWMRKTLDLMKKEGIHKSTRWMANSRANIADPDVYRAMKDAGCIGLGFGVESGNQEILNKIKKGITKEMAAQAIRYAKEAGLQSNAFFILGHPGETRHTIRDTINFACQLNPTVVCFGIMIPYPGTEIYQMARKGEGGYVNFHEEWEAYTKYHGKGVELRGLSTATLKRYQKQAYVEFYLRNRRVSDLFGFLKRYLRVISSYCDRQ